MIAFAVFVLCFVAALAAGLLMERSTGRMAAVAGSAALAGWLASGLFAVTVWAWPAPLLLGVGVVAWLFGVLADHRPLPAIVRHGVALAIFAAMVVGSLPLFLLRTATGLELPAPVLVGLLLAIALILRLVSDRVHVPETHRVEAYALLLVAPTLLMAVTVAGIVDQPAFWWQAGLASLPVAIALLHRLRGPGPLGEAGGLLLGLATGYVVLSTLSFGWVTPVQWVIIGLVALVVELRSKFRRSAP
jgi:hypothetical protein